MTSQGGSGGDQIQLPEQSQVVETSPAFNDAISVDPEDVDSGEHDFLSRRRHAHELSAMGPPGSEPFDNDVPLGDQLLHLAVPIGYCLAEHCGRLAHALGSIWSTRERRIMVDERGSQVAIDGFEVALTEQFLDECLDELLVVGDAISCHGPQPQAGTGLRPSQELGVFGRASQRDTAWVAKGARPAVQAEHDLVRRCRSVSDVADLRHVVLASLRRFMPVDAAFFATADPATLLFTGAYAEEPLTEATALFLDNEYGPPDVNSFASLATSTRHVGSLDAATKGDRRSSLRYRDIMGPIGLGDELRAALVVGGQCWGYICLHREDHRLGFTSTEAALVARVGPHIAHALRQSVLVPQGALPATDLREPGVVLLAEDLSVLGITPRAEQLLSLVDTQVGGLQLPVAVYAVAAAVRPAPPDLRPRPVLPSARSQTVTGSWLDIHASLMPGPTGDTRIAVVVEAADPRATMPLLLSARGLTARESEVALLVLRGSSTNEIVDQLHLSPHTVQDHLKAIFDKTGVRSRRELVGQFLSSARSDPG